MEVAGIIWLFGAGCAWAICLASNHGSPEHKFSGDEIIWISVLWPFAVLVWAGLSLIDWCERGVS